MIFNTHFFSCCFGPCQDPTTDSSQTSGENPTASEKVHFILNGKIFDGVLIDGKFVGKVMSKDMDAEGAFDITFKNSNEKFLPKNYMEMNYDK